MVSLIYIPSGVSLYIPCHIFSSVFGLILSVKLSPPFGSIWPLYYLELLGGIFFLSFFPFFLGMGAWRGVDIPNQPPPVVSVVAACLFCRCAFLGYISGKLWADASDLC